MADGKKSILLYADYIHIFESMDDDEAGRLAKHLFRYVNDKNPEAPDKLTKIAFEPIKAQLKRDLLKWEEKKTGYSDAGKDSAKSKRLASESQLYIIRMHNDDEEFIKIGITSLSIGRRFSASGENISRSGYRYDILYQHFEKTSKTPVHQIESLLHKKFAAHKVTPKIKFGGHTECFEMQSLNNIVDYLTSFNIVQHRSTKSTVTVNVNDNVISKENKKKIFEDFRKGYPGTKRGLNTEFEDFCKKHEDWEDVVEKLSPSLKNEILDRSSKSQKHEFIPPWKNLKTWLYNRCWEQEFNAPEIIQVHPLYDKQKQHRIEQLRHQGISLEKQDYEYLNATGQA